MPVSDRSAPFFFSLDPRGVGWGGASTNLKPIPINAFTPIEIENDHFKGQMMMFHDTGSEPGMELDGWTPEDALPGERQKRGVELQIQGRFLKPCAPWNKTSGLWVCAELESPMKLGWLMQNVIKMIMAFVKKKSDGRFYYNLGTAAEKPHLAFPLGQVFTCIVTPPGKEAPKLGSPELTEMKWQGPEGIELRPENTYTFFYKTPFADLCTWEVLGVPGVSPLGGEKLVGDVTKVRLLFFDLDKAGSHAACRDGAVLEFLCERGKLGDKWAEMEPGAQEPTLLAEPSEASDDSDRGEQGDEEEIVEVVEEAAQAEEDDSDDDEEPLEDEDKLSMVESMQLRQLEAWRPSGRMATYLDGGGEVKVPFYIEAVDRRRRLRLHVWYVFHAKLTTGQETREWWHTLAVPQLVPLCRKRPKMKRTFRRGRTAAMVKRYGAQSLEQFRHEVSKQLVHSEGTKLREAIVKAATSGFGFEESNSRELMSPSQSPKTIKEVIKNPRGRKYPLLPPRFCNGASRACELAFAQAKDGKATSVHEGVVGCIQFEGRMCEELLRLGQDGSLRLFAAYDCDKPRVKLSKAQISHVQALPGIFLGRFYLWEIHTELCVLTICSSDIKERETWIEKMQANLQDSAQQFTYRAGNGGTVGGDQMQFLVDNTRVLRWRPSRRVVLNNRRPLSFQSPSVVPPEVAATLLEQVLALADKPQPQELADFYDATCILKGVRVGELSQSQCLAFWMNVYHCLLLHGRIVLGTPKSRRELTKFNTRVSYLVGCRPISLHEIERHILKCPVSDRVAVNAVSSTAQRGRSKAQLAMSAMYSRVMLSFCPARVEEQQAAEEARQLEAEASLEVEDGVQHLQEPPRQQDIERASSSSLTMRSPDEAPATLSRRFLGQECFPTIMQPSLPNIRRPFPEPPCMFLGWFPGRYKPLNKDRRVTLVLNRGNMESLTTIPIFSTDLLDKQLDDVASTFLLQNLQQKSSTMLGQQQVLLLPHCCRGLHREMQRDRDAVLKFIGQFIPADKKVNEKVSIAFKKYLGVPRKLGDLKRMKFSDGLEPPAAAPFDMPNFFYPRVMMEIDAQMQMAETTATESRVVTKTQSSSNDSAKVSL